MSRIKLAAAYVIVNDAFADYEEDVPICSLTDALIDIELNNYFRNTTGQTYTDVIREGLFMSDNEIKALSDKLGAFVHSSLDMNEYGRGYNLPWKYTDGILTIPYCYKGPSLNISNICNVKHNVSVEVIVDELKHGLRDHPRFDKCNWIDLAIDYFNYTAVNFFHGFVKNVPHPLSTFFDVAELTEAFFKDEDSSSLKLEDMLYEIFGEMSDRIDNIFMTLIELMKLSESSVVHLYRAEHHNTIRVLIEPKTVEELFFYRNFDHEYCTVKAAGNEASSVYCTSQL